MFMGSGLRGEPATVPANRASLTAGVIMQSLSFRTRRFRLAAAALLLLSAVSAQACEIWRDEDLGVWRGNCNLKDFLVKQSFIATYQPRLIFKWPDLHIREFDYYVNGSSIEVYAEVENIGMGNAIASPVTVDVSIGNPLTGMQVGNSLQFTAQVPALPRNSSQSVYVGTVTVPPTAQDWDLIVFGVTDPPTMAQPIRGTVTESDETNNSRNHTCRWYGPNPDTSLAGCN
jgi:hypothetical protein